MAGVQQRQQCDNAAFAAVVGAQDQKRVFDRDDEDQRPQDQRHHAEDSVIRQRSAMSRRLGGFLQGVEGAGTDIAIDDTKGTDRGCCREWTEMAGGCNWRTGHWRALIGVAPRRFSRGTQSTASLRRDVANYHGDGVVGENLARLRSTVRGRQAGFLYRRLGAGGSEARRQSRRGGQPRDAIFREDPRGGINQLLSRLNRSLGWIAVPAAMPACPNGRLQRKSRRA